MTSDQNPPATSSAGRQRPSTAAVRRPGHTTIRDAHSGDLDAVAAIVTDTFAASKTARWLDPNPATRRTYARRHAAVVVDDAFTHGTVRVADHGGVPVAVALWVRHRAAGGPAALPPGDASEASLDAEVVVQRRHLLGRLLSRRHPTSAHEHLIGLGVRKGQQHTGLRAYLLTGHHHTLAELGLPACLDTDDPELRQWCRRHGYLDLDIGDQITLPDSRTRIWRMWRAPTAVDNCTL